MTFSPDISIYKYLKTGLMSLAALLLISCVTPPSPSKVESVGPRLSARPGAPGQAPARGLTEINIDKVRIGTLYVPESYTPDTAMPLLVAMHGAGGSSRYWKNYQTRAEERGFILLAPDSRASTWDLIEGGYGADIRFLDQALKYVFSRCKIDRKRVAIAGFSDGATYALSLGISNGDLFTHLIGYSPGYIAGSNPIVGKPRIYISHGKQDPVLSVKKSRDNIVPALRKAAYDVTYNEFKGGHEVRTAVSRAALDWFLGADTDS